MTCWSFMVSPQDVETHRALASWRTLDRKFCSMHMMPVQLGGDFVMIWPYFFLSFPAGRFRLVLYPRS